MGMFKRAAGLFTTIAAAGVAAQVRAAELLGQPTPGAIDLQPAASSLKHQAIFFHNIILMPIITGIVVFVLGLLIYVMVRFNKKSNPVPARWSHNTPIEVAWTVVPVLILMLIAIFSFRLLYAYHADPKPDVVIKATGNQWYWTYEYPDLNVAEYTSAVLPEDQAKTKGVPYRLAATEPLVAPVNKVVRVLVTGADVIHAFAMPAFGIKIDAIPGRVNQTWFKAEQVGTYYGQCSELCGVDHAFMPIEIHIVTQPEFDAWVASKGGGATVPSAAAGSASAPTAATSVAAAPAAAGPATTPAPAPTAPIAATKTSLHATAKAGPARLLLAAY